MLNVDSNREGNEKSNVFVCHSRPLVRFLTQEKGLRYVVVGLNPTSLSKFWVFHQDEELGQALVEWRETKPDR